MAQRDGVYTGPNAPKLDRQRRAIELQARMAETGFSPSERAAARGFTHTKKA